MRLYDHVPHAHIAARRKTGPVKVAHQAGTGANARIALAINRVVGTMWAFYLFNGIALVSLPAALQTRSLVPIINWVSSNWMQLILLPALMVSGNLQAKAADARAEATYKDADAVLHTALAIEEHLQAQDAAQGKFADDVAALADATRSVLAARGGITVTPSATARAAAKAAAPKLRDPKDVKP